MINIPNDGNILIKTRENGAVELLSVPHKTSIDADFQDRTLTRNTNGTFVFRDDLGNVAVYVYQGNDTNGCERLELSSLYNESLNAIITPPRLNVDTTPNKILEELTFVQTDEPFSYKRPVSGPFGFPVLDLFGQLSKDIPLEDAVTATPGYLSGEPTEQEPSLSSVTAGSLSNADGSFKLDLDKGAIEISESQNSLTRATVHYDDRRDLIFVGYDVTDNIDEDGALVLEIDGKVIVPAFGWTHYAFEALENKVKSVAKERISDQFVDNPSTIFDEQALKEAFRFLTDRKAA